MKPILKNKIFLSLAAFLVLSITIFFLIRYDVFEPRDPQPKIRMSIEQYSHDALKTQKNCNEFRQQLSYNSQQALKDKKIALIVAHNLENAPRTPQAIKDASLFIVGQKSSDLEGTWFKKTLSSLPRFCSTLETATMYTLILQNEKNLKLSKSELLKIQKNAAKFLGDELSFPPAILNLRALATLAVEITKTKAIRDPELLTKIQEIETETKRLFTLERQIKLYRSKREVFEFIQAEAIRNKLLDTLRGVSHAG